jgi:endo-1,3(4)-beta-glucanase
MKNFTLRFSLFLLLGCAVSEVNSQTWQYGAPFDTTAPPSVYTKAATSYPRTYLLDSLKYPYPTTSWFKCLFYGKKIGVVYPDSMVGYGPVFTYPYAVGLGAMPVPGYVSYSKACNRLGLGYQPYAVTVTSHGFPGANSVNFATGYDWYFGAVDSTLTPDMITFRPFIKTYDELSVTLKYRRADNRPGSMEAPIVKGMPYVTMKYTGLTPYFASQGRTLQAYSIDGINFINLPNPGPDTVRSNRFILKMAADGGPGNNIYYVLYASDSVTVNIYFDHHGQGSPFQGALIFQQPFNGYLRAAYLASRAKAGNNPQYDDTLNMAQKLQVLDNNCRFYPTGGTISASIENGANIADMNFLWTSSDPTNDSLLMLALPHHADVLSASTAIDTVLTQYQCIYGPLKAISGKTWNMQEPLITTGWISPEHNLTNSTIDKYRQELLVALKGDRDTITGATAFTPGYLNQVHTSTYFGGKQLAKRGRLAVIGDELKTWFPESDSVSGSIRDTLKTQMNRWLDGTQLLMLPGWKTNAFRYDTVYGGLVNLMDLTEVGIDFGNSVYTDHHFHYGYFLYAAAALAKGDTVWARNYRQKILLFARDIANPSSADKYFVRERNRDWYDGHCWAQGLSDAAGVGNNEESTSEAVNAGYGMMLLGQALGDKNLENTGRLYVSTEIRTAQKYWQIGPNSHYPSLYTDLYKVVGNLYATGINSLVAFGEVGDPKMVYGVQMVPTTPVNFNLLYEPWCDTLYNVYYTNAPMFVSDTATDIELQWATVNLAAFGRSKPGNGYAYYHKNLASYLLYSDSATRNIVNYDDGESKTNVLYNILVSGRANGLDVRLTVISDDTSGNCQGKIEAEVLNIAQADPPFHYFLKAAGSDKEVYYSTGTIDSLCQGTYQVTVIDAEFNIGSDSVTIKNLLSVDENTFDNNVLVYPNPSSDGRFTVNWGKSGKKAVEILIGNPHGQLVFSDKIASGAAGSQTINLEGRPAGIYTITIIFETGEKGYAKIVNYNRF